MVLNGCVLGHKPFVKKEQPLSTHDVLQGVAVKICKTSHTFGYCILESASDKKPWKTFYWLISLILILLLPSLFIIFYFVFTVTNFANLYFWIIKICLILKNNGRNDLPLFSFPLEFFFDLPSLFKQGGQKNPLPPSQKGEDTMF